MTDTKVILGKNSISIVLILILLAGAAYAIPDSLTLQGKLTDLSGSAQQGTFNFTFKIYDSFTDGTVLYQIINRSVKTDANGIYDVILKNLSGLNFSDQYFLGIAVQGDNESKPRINLTSSPYSFRANVSEDLNPANRYEVAVFNITGNLTIGESFADTLTVTTGRLNISDGSITAAGNLTLAEKITFSLGSIIDNLVNGFLRISSGLNVTGNVSIAQDTLFVDNTSGRVGIGTAGPYNELTVLGSVGVSGSINASSINTTGSAYFATTSGNVGIGTAIPYNTLTVIGSVGISGSLNASSINTTGSAYFATVTGRVGIGTASPGEKLQVDGNIEIAAASGGTQDLIFSEDGNSMIGLRYNGAGSGNPLDIFNFQTGDMLVRINQDSGNVGIGTTPGRRLEVSGSMNATQLNISGPANLAYGSGNVGIGTASPSDTLTVVGSVSVFGSLNATFINASGIKVGTNDVQTVNAVFNKGNYSIEYAATGFDRENVTDYIGGDNASLLRTINISKDLAKFFSNFNLANITAFLGADGNASLIRTGNLSLIFLERNSTLWNASGADIFLREISGKVGIGTTGPYNTLTVVGSVGVSGSLNASSINTTGSAYFATSSGSVGIGTTSPADTLSVVGSASVFGSLNATFINASGIKVGTNDVQTVNAVFNKGNYSIEYAATGFDRENVTDYIGGDNASLLRTINISKDLAKFFNLFTRENITEYLGDEGNASLLRTVNISKDLAKFFNLFGRENVTDYLGEDGNASLLRTVNISKDLSKFFSNFQLSNVSNNTLVKGDNVTLALWNVSGTDIFLREITGKVGIGTASPSDTLTVVGSVSVFGSLNATFINASGIKVGTNDVQTVNAVFNKGNYSIEYSATGFDRENVTDYIGRDNASLLRTINISKDLAKFFNLFGRENVTDYIGGDNASLLRTINISKDLAKFFNLFGRENVTDYLGEDGNASLLRTVNISKDLAKFFSNFNLANITAFLGADGNASLIRTGNLSLIFLERNSTLWNASGADIFLREISGRVGIGTSTPDNLLTILGNEITADAILHINASDNFNTSVVNVLTLDHVLKNAVNSTGGVGVSILFRATDNASQLSNIGNISAILYNATNGSQLSALTFSTRGPDTGDGSFGHLIERLRIDGYGRVGINTTTPNETLALVGTLSVTSGSGVLGLHQDSSGNIGIGTFNPNTKLEVNGTTTLGGDLNVPLNDINIGGGYTRGGITLIGQGDDIGSGQFAKDILIDGQIISINDIEINQSFIPVKDLFSLLGNTSKRFLDVFVANIKAGNRTLNITGNVSIGEDTLFVDNTSGRVGIGTATPTQKLHVEGDTNITGSLIVAGENITAGTNISVLYGFNGSAGTFVPVRVTADGALALSIVEEGGSSGWVDDGTTVKLATSTDNLGLGTSTAAEKLVVAGNVNISGTLNVSGRVSFPDLTSCDSIDTDANGVLSCGTDIGAGGTNSSLWNVSGSNIFPKDITVNVGIGTAAPDNILTILGNELTADAILHLNASDNFNTTVVNVLTLDHVLKNAVNSTGGVGVSILFRATDNASQLSNIGNISAILYNATNGSQLSALTFSTRGPDTGDGSFGHLLERLRIDGYGRVGINTTNPTATLHVVGNVNITGRLDIGTLNISGVTFSQGDLTVDNSLIVNGGANITGDLGISGRVGVGTLAPVETLSVDGNFSVTGNLSFGGGLTIGGDFIGTDGVGPNAVSSGWVDDGTVVRLIDATNNVGIGTISPSQKLEVAGYINVTGTDTSNSTFNGDVRIIGTLYGSSPLKIGGGLNVTTGNIIFPDGTVQTSAGESSGGGNSTAWNRTGTNVILSSLTDRVGIGDSSPYNELVVIGSVGVSGSLNASSINVTGNAYFATSSGNVGIGTSSPNYKLDVVGSINATNINATGIIQATTFIGSGSSLTGIISVTPAWNSSGSNVYLNDTTASVGIGTTAPNDALEVVGNVRVSGSINATNLNTTGQTILASSSGNVGIGTAAPAERLHVMGNLRVISDSDVTTELGSGIIYTQNIMGDIGLHIDVNEIQTVGDNLHLQINSVQDLDIGGGDLYVETASGNVGIGDTTPDYALEILSTTVPQFAISNDDGNDYATFDVSTAGLLTITTVDQAAALGHIVLMPDGNVGIGTTTPNDKLTVIGNVNVTGGNISITSDTNEVNTTGILFADGSFQASAPNFQRFTSSGTWNKSPGAVVVIVECFGAGGGGDNGGTTRGNGGSGGGSRTLNIYDAGALGATETITIGAGGAESVPGGTTTFGSFQTAYGGGDVNGGLGGGGGAGSRAAGDDGSGASGAAGGAGDAPGGNGGNEGVAGGIAENGGGGGGGGSSSGNGGGGGASINAGAGGGGGGGGASGTGGAGGAGEGAGGAGGAGGGGAGSNGTDSTTGGGGGGGGGGGNGSSGAGGAGGNGGAPGGGGGTGGEGTTGGAGGTGARGECRVWSY